MSQVVLEKVSKVYPGGVKAVDGIDLHVADREFVVLVGPSGCGKSTTLRMIAGLEELTSGVIRIGDRVVNDLRPKERDVAMVFQNYALYPHLTVYQNLAFGLKVRGVDARTIHQRVTDIARVLEIWYLLDRKPRQLSGGQKQRVAVGRAIVREPAAFLFDEPLSNLDAKLRVTTRAELKRLHQRFQTTTLYVTHDQEEAMTLGDRIVVMKDGVIHQAATPIETYHSPANRFVAGFIGMPPMNFLDGRLVAQAGGLIFEEQMAQNQHADAAPNGNGRATIPPEELTLPANGFTLAVPPHLCERLRSYVGRQIVLGFRPEHVSLSKAAQADVSLLMPMKVRLTLIEPLGNNMDVYASTCLHGQVVARVEAHDGLKAFSSATFYVDASKAHFFAPGDAGMNLSQTSETYPHVIA